VTAGLPHKLVRTSSWGFAVGVQALPTSCVAVPQLGLIEAEHVQPHSGAGTVFDGELGAVRPPRELQCMARCHLQVAKVLRHHALRH